MEDNSRSTSHEFYSIFGLGSLCRACRSFVSKCYPEKIKSPRKQEAPKKIKTIAEEFEDDQIRKDQVRMEEVHSQRCEGDGFLKHPNFDAPSTKSSPTMSRTASRKHQTTTPAAAVTSLLRSMSRRNSIDGGAAALQRSLSRTASNRRSSTIMFSNSTGVLRPPPMEKTLECTLEELCFGCVKKIKISRDAITDHGQIIQEEEMLTVKVKPGWSRGTKITFEGMGNEIPATGPADVVFEITERRHPLYRREGDDLELAIEIPLVKALTGCTIPVPLLGGSTMDLEIDEIIHPGHQKIIATQGMPKSKEQGERGNLIITFLVEFPQELTDEQKSEVVSILEDSCYSTS